MTTNSSNLTPHQVEFEGQTGEYFGIWFVNILLTIVTFGIYSAWAKVRTRRYFYGNTIIDNNTFDYHATGKQIFIGRLIAFAVIILINIIASLNPFLTLALIPIYLFGIPWLLIRATRFNARMTSYRNVRFNFAGKYWDAFITFVLLPITIPLTFGLTTPIVTRRTNRFIINGHKYGDRPFNFASPLGPFYKVFLMIYGVALLLIIAVFALFAFASFDLNSIAESTGLGNLQELEGLVSITAIFAIYAFLPILIIFGLIYSAAVRNIVYRNTILDERHHFNSTIHVGRYAWIIISNFVLTILTIGFMRPWAAIRLAKYTAVKTQVLANGALDTYSSEIRDSSGVIAGEYFDLEGVDIGGAI